MGFGYVYEYSESRSVVQKVFQVLEIEFASIRTFKYVLLTMDLFIIRHTVLLLPWKLA